MGVGELLAVLAIVVLLFGGSRLPELGKGLGQGLRSFRDALKGEGEKQLEEDTASKKDDKEDDHQKR